jgi:hypothetical protein
VPVEIGQAGGQVACPSCGAQLDVPPLRKLRHLPVAAAESQPVPSTWGARQGVATAGLILAAVLVSVALWNRFSEPAVPQFDPAARLQSVDRGLESMTPAQAWQMWVELYRPMATRGFAIIEDPHKPAIEQHIAKQRFFQKTLLVAAAIFAVVALATILWPRPRRYFPA